MNRKVEEHRRHLTYANPVNVTATEARPFPKIEVQTYNAGSRQKEPFFIVFYR